MESRLIWPRRKFLQHKRMSPSFWKGYKQSTSMLKKGRWHLLSKYKEVIAIHRWHSKLHEIVSSLQRRSWAIYKLCNFWSSRRLLASSPKMLDMTRSRFSDSYWGTSKLNMHLIAEKVMQLLTADILWGLTAGSQVDVHNLIRNH